MYISIYVYRLPQVNVDAFLRVQREAAEIYRRHGALDDETLAPVNLLPKYGCMSFKDAFPASEDEEIMVGVSRFRDRAHHDEVMAKVDADKRISELYQAVRTLVDVSRIARGEFGRVV